MTLQGAIDRADEVKPNSMSRELKVQLLSELDGLICREILAKHEKKETDPAWEEFAGYDAGTDQGTVLIAPWPYDKMYAYWLMANIDEQNLEMDKYANDSTQFNTYYRQFHDWWRREHMPLQAVRQFRI